jgi:hypothetical protein
MKKLKNLKGAKLLSKTEQKSVMGGKVDLCKFIRCIPEEKCINGKCVPFMDI